MKMNHTLLIITLGFLLSSCASDPIDPLDPTLGDTAARQPQCPIGYKPVYSTEIVVKSSDKDKKPGQTTKGFKCELER